MNRSKIKKLLVVTTLSDRSETDIYIRLQQDCFNVHVICDPDAPEISKLTSAGITIITAGLSQLPKRQTQHLIRYCVKEQSIDVVYAPRTFTLSASIRALRNIPVKLIGYRGTTGHLGLFDFGPRHAYTHPKVDRIVCVSNAVREYLKCTGIKSDKLVTIRKGHDVEWYKPAERKSLSSFGIPDNAFVVGFSGHVRKVKGLEYLVAAMVALEPASNIHLLIAGEMADKSVRRQIDRSKSKDRIHCTGFRKDAPSLIGACSAFVMPSIKREGLPRALVEAMAQGVPSIGTYAGGIPELIEDNVSGILVPPKNSRALAEKIMLLASDSALARRISEKGIARIRMHFNIDDTTQQMKQLFLE